MMIRRMVAAVAVAGTAVIGFAGAAQASDQHHHDPQVAWVHHVRASDESATLKAKYRCWGGDEGTHLWVSLKQGGGITGSAEDLAAQQGTSQVARAWYDSHPGMDAGTKGPHCNGKWQVQRFTVNRERTTDDQRSAKGDLEDGPAFLQFCLFDSTADPQGMDLSHGFGYLYTYVDVKD